VAGIGQAAVTSSWVVRPGVPAAGPAGSAARAASTPRLANRRKYGRGRVVRTRVKHGTALFICSHLAVDRALTETPLVVTVTAIPKTVEDQWGGPPLLTPTRDRRRLAAHAAGHCAHADRRTRTPWVVELVPRSVPRAFELSPALLPLARRAATMPAPGPPVSTRTSRLSLMRVASPISMRAAHRYVGFGLLHQADAHDGPSCVEAPNAGEFAIGQAR
jgi:hypothetical protein